MKPWEETWGVAIGDQLHVMHGPDPLDSASFAEFDDPERAQLASAAPDMARVLLAIEWSGSDEDGSHCPSCFARAWVPPERHDAEGKYIGYTEGTHEPDCAWLAALRKAGVRDAAEPSTPTRTKEVVAAEMRAAQQRADEANRIFGGLALEFNELLEAEQDRIAQAAIGDIMIITDIVYVKGRGPVACMKYDADALPVAGKASLRRASDNAIWMIRGIDKWALELRSWRDCPIGFLLPEGASIAVGDEVTVEPHA